MSTTTLEQQRAAFALSRVDNLRKSGVSQYGNYVSFVKALPPTILQIGLGQALATELAAGAGADSQNDNDKPNPTKQGHYHLCRDLCAWLGRDSEDAPYTSVATRGVDLTDPKGLLETMMNNHEVLYIRAQTEALAYLAWLKKFAVAYLVAEVPGNNNKD